MITTDLDTYTDYLARTNSTMFPVAEKLLYYNIAYGILNSLVMKEQEDTYEEEDTKDTVAGQRDYLAKARIHHVNWLKIDYGNGFVPATYKSEADLISEYGSRLEDRLTNWNPAKPIYWYKGSSLFVVPAPTSDQAGTDKLKVSHELLPADLTAGDTPQLPANFHYLLGVYAAWQYHLKQTEPEAQARQQQFTQDTETMLDTMFPRARQREQIAHVPDDNGFND